MLECVRINAPVLKNGFTPAGVQIQGLFDKGGFTSLGEPALTSAESGSCPCF